MYHPTLEEFRALRNQGNLVPIYREIVADSDTPVSAFLKVNHGGYSFLLESVGGGEHVAHYSFIGTEERIRFVAERSRGFIYLVSVTRVTGVRDRLPANLEAFVARVVRGLRNSIDKLLESEKSHLG